MRYSSKQVSERTGLTYRQVDYFCRTGVLEPVVPARGCGSKREFSDSDLARALLVASLLQQGYTLRYVRSFVAEPPALASVA